MARHLHAIFFVVELLAFGLTADVFYFLPLWSRRTIFFSVTVAPGFRDSNEGRAILRRYRGAVLVHALIAFGLFVAGFWTYPPWGLLAGLLWLIAGLSHAHHQARKRTERYATQPSTLPSSSHRTAATRLPGGWVVQAGPFAIVLASFLYLRLHWSQVPAQYPIHWDLEGHANGWARKGMALGIGGFVGMAAPLAAILLLTYFAAHHSRRVAAEGEAGEFEREHQRSNLRCLTIGSYLLAIIFSVVNLMSLHPSPDAAALASVAIIFLTLIAVALMLVGRSKTPGPSGGGRPAEEGNPTGDRTEDRYWKWGFYVNPNDPALVVPKRVGTGYTFNMAQPKARLGFAALLGGFLLYLTLVVFHL